MPKRTRSRTRARTAVAARPSEGTSRGRSGGMRGLGAPRASGAPSAALLKAAAWERAYVVRDFRRIAVVVGITLALLVVAGIAINLLLK
ncbi:MAG: hypothetical protein HY071_03285 [Chloroflexi bacterium]|nr:hypothetical protein [Chloroflexota bacterium]